MRIRKLMLAVPALALAALAVVPQGVAAAAPSGAPAHMSALAAMRSGVPVTRVVRTAQPATATPLVVAPRNDSHGCSGSEASNNSYVHVCYVRDGDVLWVRDDESNGRTAVGEILYWDGNTLYDGYCYDRYSYASGLWDSCGFPEADENQTVSYRGFDTDGNGNWAHYTAWQDEPSN